MIAKLANITPITMDHGTQITIVNRVYKPTYNVWGPRIVYIYISGQITLILTSSPSCLNLFPMITVLVR